MKKSLAAIEAQIAKLKAAADKIRKEEVSGVIDRIRTAIKHYELTAADLGFGPSGVKSPGRRAGAAAKSSKGVAKYRDAATGKTWTGRGKPPAWIAGVADRSAYLIAGQAEGAAAAPTRRATVAAKPTRGGVAKYQDPQTGKTWTGVGKPPAWIAGASDRTPYLIGAGKPGSGGETGAPEASAPAASDGVQRKTRARRGAASAPQPKGRAGKKAPVKRAAKPGKVASATESEGGQTPA